MNKRWEEVTQLAKELGLDFFPVVYEVISQSVMDNICSYGLPIRFNHWSFGRTYDQQKMHGEMGYSKIYEVILNNNPSYAFMMDTNTDVQNIFIVAHCAGHSAFFKNNYMFKNTNRNMVAHAAEHAGRVQEYIERYGIDKVERIIDIGMALENHIDWHKGLYRKDYDKKSVKVREVVQNEFDDLLEPRKNYQPIKELVNSTLPPSPEKDLLFFLTKYAPLEDWERDVLDIIREEAYYFYPQRLTKISNEGFASYWHAEVMNNYDGLSAAEHMDFARDHEKVVQPGGNPFRINPYYLGYKIFKDIEKRYGQEKVFEVMQTENDISFIRNYLTMDLIKEMNLFVYGYDKEYAQDHRGDKYIQIHSKMRDDVVEALVSPLYNGGMPKIVIEEAKQGGQLTLRHISEEVGTLNIKYAKKTVEYIWELWAAPVELYMLNDSGETIKVVADEGGTDVVVLGEQLDFGLSNNNEQRDTKKIWMP